MTNIPRFLMIHTSDVKQDIVFDQFNSINTYHRDEKKFPISSLGYYIGYHYLITGNKIYQCRLDTDEGSHCDFKVNGVSMNFQSIGVCWGGDGDVELPNSALREHLRRCISDLMYKYDIPIDRVVFHRDYNNQGKTCPGTLFTRDYLLNFLQPPAGPKPITNMCVEEGKIIETQKQQIGRLQILVQSLLATIRSFFGRA